VPVLLVTAQPAQDAVRFPWVRGVFQKPLEVPELLRRLGDVCFDALPTLGMEPITP
jgi:hypothetical protein